MRYFLEESMTKAQLKAWALEHPDPIDVLKTTYEMYPLLVSGIPSKEKIKEILIDLEVENILLNEEYDGKNVKCK